MPLVHVFWLLQLKKLTLGDMSKLAQDHKTARGRSMRLLNPALAPFPQHRITDLLR
jgi:hypothetical protein